MTTESSLKDVVRQLTFDPKGRRDLFLTLPLSERSAAFNSLSPRLRQELLKNLSLEEAVELLDHLDPNRVHYILGGMKDVRRRKRIIGRLKKDRYAKVEQFLQFHQEAEMSLVHLNYVLLVETTTIAETAEIIERHVRETGKVPVVLVSRSGELVGEVPLGTLVRESNRDELGEYVRPTPTILFSASRNEVVDLVSAKPHKTAVVLDEDGSVLGVIYSDDVLALLEKTPAAALYDFAGVSETERSFDSIKSKVKHRYKWLIINLGTAFLAASVVGLYEETLNQLVVLAIYMPIVAGMGGNAATQTLAVIVRGITLGEIALRNAASAIIKEVFAGLANGIITGAIVAVVAILWNGNPALGLVLAVAMVFNLMVAGFFGASVPLIMRALGKDPATSATIFITTATDVLGFFAFLGLATWILI